MNEITRLNEVIGKIQIVLKDNELNELPELKMKAQSVLDTFRPSTPEETAYIEQLQSQLSVIFQHVDARLAAEQDKADENEQQPVTKTKENKANNQKKDIDKESKVVSVKDRWQQLEHQVDQLEEEKYDPKTREMLAKARTDTKDNAAAQQSIVSQLKNTQTFEEKAQQHARTAEKAAQMIKEFKTQIEQEKLKAEQQTVKSAELHQELTAAADVALIVIKEAQVNLAIIKDDLATVKNHKTDTTDLLTTVNALQGQAQEQLDKANRQSEMVKKQSEQLNKSIIDIGKTQQLTKDVQSDVKSRQENISKLLLVIRQERAAISDLHKMAMEETATLQISLDDVSSNKAEVIKLKEQTELAKTQAVKSLNSIEDYFNQVTSLQEITKAHADAGSASYQETLSAMKNHQAQVKDVEAILAEIKQQRAKVEVTLVELQGISQTVNSYSQETSVNSAASAKALAEIKDLQAKIQSSVAKSEDAQHTMSDNIEIFDKKIEDNLAHSQEQLEQLTKANNDIIIINKGVQEAAIKAQDSQVYCTRTLTGVQHEADNLQKLIKATRDNAKQAHTTTKENKKAFGLLAKEYNKITTMAALVARALKSATQSRDQAQLAADKAIEAQTKAEVLAQDVGVVYADTKNLNLSTTQNAAEIKLLHQEINSKDQNVTKLHAKAKDSAAKAQEALGEVSALAFDTKDVAVKAESILDQTKKDAQLAEASNVSAAKALDKMQETLNKAEQARIVDNQASKDALAKLQAGLIAKEEELKATLTAEQQGVLELINDAKTQLADQVKLADQQTIEHQKDIEQKINEAKNQMQEQVKAVEQKQVSVEKRVQALLSQDIDDSSPLKLAEATLDRAERLMSDALALSKSGNAADKKKSRFKRK